MFRLMIFMVQKLKKIRPPKPSKKSAIGLNLPILKSAHVMITETVQLFLPPRVKLGLCKNTILSTFVNRL